MKKITLGFIKEDQHHGSVSSQPLKKLTYELPVLSIFSVEDYTASGSIANLQESDSGGGFVS